MIGAAFRICHPTQAMSARMIGGPKNLYRRGFSEPLAIVRLTLVHPYTEFSGGDAPQRRCLRRLRRMSAGGNDAPAPRGFERTIVFET
jgi:hypothetical protein